MSKTPGTVSKILWHFTGGPRWDKSTNSQSEKAKSPASAYRALLGILNDERINLSGYGEVLPYRPFLEEDRQVVYPLDRVCCLADIPIQHLSYHQQRYGKYAIGFHRNSVLNAGFNPVSYIWHDAKIGQSLNDIVEYSDPQYIQESIQFLTEVMAHLSEEEKTRVSKKFDWDPDSVLLNLEMTLNLLLPAIPEFLNNIKMLNNVKQLSDFYCEREWRLSGEPFDFDLRDDVAMVVLPKNGSKCNYDRFFKDFPSFPQSIPVVPWEDLIEH